MSQTATLTQDDVDRAERRRTNLILAYRNIGVHIEEDTPLSEIPAIDQITKLRMLATKHRRPISHIDLTDRAAVARELDRLMMLEGGTRRKGSYKTKRVEPCPANLSPAQKRARALESKKVRDGGYATGRFSETVGYGSHSSYSVQVAEARSMGAESLIREATEGQLDYIKSLAAQKRIKIAQLPTRFDIAQDLLDELIAAPANATPGQLKYVTDLEAKLDIKHETAPTYTFDQASARIDALKAEVAKRNAR